MFRNIDSERMKKKITRKQLCEMLKVSQPTLRAWINRETELPATKLIEMANYFDCSVDYLLVDYQDSGIA